MPSISSIPSIHLPYINIVLDAFALIVALVILCSCFGELSSKKKRSLHFTLLAVAVIVALAADIVSWLVEGHPSFKLLIIASNTIASCAGQFAIICFMGYLKDNLYESSRAAAVTLKIFRIFCRLSILFSIGNAFFGYTFYVNELGHYEHTKDLSMGILYLLFPIMSFFVLVLMAVFARSSTKTSRVAFLVYTLFPAAGIIIDYTVHGLSLTYVGLTVSTLVIYTSIYLKKEKLIESQQNALMISQINPHFIYNTLSTIASMCDIAPTQAKQLTIDFSKYLRQNLNNMSSDILIPFEQELEHIECYLKIEKARFRENLNVIYSIQCKDFLIPPLTIQPLVENAVKHGVTKKANGGTIKISTYEEKKHYIIEIIDDGAGYDTSVPPSDNRAHVGLQNVKSRVMSLCRGDLTVKSTFDVGTRVTIEIPKKKRRRKI